MTTDKPDRAALEVAYSHLGMINKTLDELLANPATERVLNNVARIHMKKRTSFDAKKARLGEQGE